MENNERRKKINLVDIVIIVVILAIAVLFGWKFFGGAQSPAKSGEIQYTVLVEGVPKESYDNIAAKANGKTIANGGYINCEILSLEAAPCQVLSVEKSDVSEQYSSVTYAPTGEFVNLTFRLKAAVDLNSVLTEVGSQEVRVGRSHIVKTKYFEFTGVIMTVERAD